MQYRRERRICYFHLSRESTRYIFISTETYLIFYYIRYVSKIRQKLRHEKQKIITRTFQLRNFKGTLDLQKNQMYAFVHSMFIYVHIYGYTDLIW